MDTAAARDMQREAQHCLNIAPSTPLSLRPPMCWSPLPQQEAAFAVQARVRVQKATRPGAPGTLQLSNKLKANHRTWEKLNFLVGPGRSLKNCHVNKYVISSSGAKGALKLPN